MSIGAGKSTLQFEYQRDGYRVNNEEIPEAAIAYDAESIFRMLRSAGFELVFHQPGGWSGRPVVGEDYYQDVLVLRLRA